MATMMTRIRVDDYEAWKSMFDRGKDDIRRDATGHRIARGVSDPSEVFIAVDFESPEAAERTRERLQESGALDRVELQAGPTVVEPTEAVTY